MGKAAVAMDKIVPPLAFPRKPHWFEASRLIQFIVYVAQSWYAEMESTSQMDKEKAHDFLSKIRESVQQELLHCGDSRHVDEVVRLEFDNQPDRRGRVLRMAVAPTPVLEFWTLEVDCADPSAPQVLVTPDMRSFVDVFHVIFEHHQEKQTD